MEVFVNHFLNDRSNIEGKKQTRKLERTSHLIEGGSIRIKEREQCEMHKNVSLECKCFQRTSYNYFWAIQSFCGNTNGKRALNLTVFKYEARTVSHDGCGH